MVSHISINILLFKTIFFFFYLITEAYLVIVENTDKKEKEKFLRISLVCNVLSVHLLVSHSWAVPSFI